MMDEQERRKAAIERVKAKREFKAHVVAYFVVNVFLVGVWYMSGADYFWPIWVILGWGIGIVTHGYSVYRGERPISEEEIQREMRDF